ncbi:hypothetical protein PTKIN_Ptkin05aG0114700 [Pterospermum kingtungense]
MEGLSYVSEVPFVLIDLVNLRSIDVNVENKSAWVEAGATIGELYYRIAEKSGTLAFLASTCHTVGVGGHFNGGAYGTLFRKYGLVADNIIDAYLIDANGKVLDRKSMGEDLFWVIRGGGGGSFGIVLAWKIKLVVVPASVTLFTVTNTFEQNATQLIHHWQYVAYKISNDIFLFVAISRENSSEQGNKTIQTSFNALFLGKFPIEKPEVFLARTTASKSLFKVKSDYVKEPIPKFVFEGMHQSFYEEEGRYASLNFVPYGGKMDEISEAETPFPHRSGNIYHIMYVTGEGEETLEFHKYISWMRRFYRYMTPYISKSPREAYVNYRDLDIGVNNKGNTSYARSSI